MRDEKSELTTRIQAFGGSPSENLYGSDLSAEFMSLGYDLFLDKDKLKSKFIAANIFDPDSDLMKQLTNKVDIVHTSAFFHLFNLEDQLQIAKRVINLVRPRPGSLVIGRQVGNINPSSIARRSGSGTRYRHDDASWIKMWEQASQETGTSWKIEATLFDSSHFSNHAHLFTDKGLRILKFTMRLE